MRINAFWLRKAAIVVVLVLATVTFSCDAAAPGRPEKVFVSEAGRFEAIFPSEPEVGSQNLVVDSESFNLYTHTVQTRLPTARYSIFFFEIAGELEIPTVVFDSLAEGGLEELRAYEIDRKDVLFGKHPSRVISAATADGSFLKVQFIHTGRRLYQVMAYFPSEGRSKEETSSKSEPLADKFINSFKLSPNL